MGYLKKYSSVPLLLIAGFLFSLYLSSCEKASEGEKNRPADIGSMSLIPAGEFILGNDNIDLSKIPDQLRKMKKWGEDQKPEQKMSLPAFYIDRYEVANEQFLKFKKQYSFPIGQEKLPAVNLNWHDAKAYCGSLGKRLPTEFEWEKAARGPRGLLFPWGGKFDPKKANTGFSKLSSATVGGAFPEDVSYYKVYDMAGNVSEWTSSWYNPYKGSQYKSPNFGETQKVSRGGSFQDMGHYELEIFSSTTFRYYNGPDEWAGDTGFRCAKSAE